MKAYSSQPRKVRRTVRARSEGGSSHLLSGALSKDLKEKYSIAHLRIRKGDTVKIMRGDFKGIEGKVIKVFKKTGRITIEGVTREKLKGGSVPIKIHASKVMVTNLNLDDKARRKKLEK